jgi:hypothetical protein
MIQSSSTYSGGQVIESMVQLAGCSKSHRIIVAGSSAREHLLELRRRGYAHAATTAMCGLPRGQYNAALLDWRRQSVKALETALCWLVDFLAPAAVLVIRLDSLERTSRRTVARVLERLGFQIEAGSRCEDGIAILARRRNTTEMKIAA